MKPPKLQLGSWDSLLKSVGFGVWAGVLSGAASALFLASLAWVTSYRETHPKLLFLLPLGGAAIVLLYQKSGKDAERGSNLLLERIHDPGEMVPLRMAPLVLIGTLATHLFGGSAGREGTAVQMGGALAGALERLTKLTQAERRLLLMSGISGGFGAVFGTPLAGTVFGMEVLTIGHLAADAIIPCFVAAIVGDGVCRSLGLAHFAYPHLAAMTRSPVLWGQILLLGLLSGGMARLFVACTHGITALAKAKIRIDWLRPVIGGVVVLALTYAVGTRDYLGLGLPLIARSFTPQGVFWAACLLKLLFTAVTLGTGYKGGEVTPLFCIGATLGAAYSHFAGQPTAAFAALGFIAVFAGAANTPLACTLMGIELFGAEWAIPMAAACLIAFAVSGQASIYTSQRSRPPETKNQV